MHAVTEKMSSTDVGNRNTHSRNTHAIEEVCQHALIVKANLLRAVEQSVKVHAISTTCTRTYWRRIGTTQNQDVKLRVGWRLQDMARYVKS
jgi:hypothetical protein